MCYGERFPLYIKDAKPKPQTKPVKKISDDTNKKLEHILLLLTALLEGEKKARIRQNSGASIRCATKLNRGTEAVTPTPGWTRTGFLFVWRTTRSPPA